MGLWDFVKNAGKALGIGDAEAAEAPPAPAALEKEVDDLGLKAEGLKVTVDGDTVKLTGRAASQAEKEKLILAVGNVAGVAKVEETIETPGAGGRAGLPHGEEGRHALEISERTLGKRRALQGDLRGQPADAEGPRQDLPRPGAAHPGEVAPAAAALVRRGAPDHYPAPMGLERPAAREERMVRSRLSPTSSPPRRKWRWRSAGRPAPSTSSSSRLPPASRPPGGDLPVQVRAEGQGRDPLPGRRSGPKSTAPPTSSAASASARATPSPIILPNGVEAAVALLAGATAGIVEPINPLLAPENIAGILADTGAKVVVTLAPFPKTDLAQKVARALALAPGVEAVVEVDLHPYLAPPLPGSCRSSARTSADSTGRGSSISPAPGRGERRGLDFAPAPEDRVCAFFHTGGTTGRQGRTAPGQRHPLQRLVRQVLHLHRGGRAMCPLPLFHVFAAYPILMSCLMTGAQMVMPTPQGYRGEGVMDNFWKLIARHKVTFLITVPTAVAALMQRKVDADVSTLRLAISGSAAMPVELFHRFEAATGVRVMEGYGLTEATCLVAINPPDGERKIGASASRSPIPMSASCAAPGRRDPEGMRHRRDRRVCVKNPGVGGVYTDPPRNRGVLTADGICGPAISGAIDADGYIWITGRAKDLIIRGGHNIDPALIEDALMQHPAVAFAGAIGQPDARAGELPAAYVELVAGGARAGGAHGARRTISRKRRRYQSTSDPAELPKTAVGKVFKPDLRRRAIAGSSTPPWPRRVPGAGRRGGRGPAPRAGRRAGPGPGADDAASAEGWATSRCRGNGRDAAAAATVIRGSASTAGGCARCPPRSEAPAAVVWFDLFEPTEAEETRSRR